jgi:hypothetical protein
MNRPALALSIIFVFLLQVDSSADELEIKAVPTNVGPTRSPQRPASLNRLPAPTNLRIAPDTGAADRDQPQPFTRQCNAVKEVILWSEAAFLRGMQLTCDDGVSPLAGRQQGQAVTIQVNTSADASPDPLVVQVAGLGIGWVPDTRAFLTVNLRTTDLSPVPSAQQDLRLKLPNGYVFKQISGILQPDGKITDVYMTFTLGRNPPSRFRLTCTDIDEVILWHEKTDPQFLCGMEIICRRADSEPASVGVAGRKEGISMSLKIPKSDVVRGMEVRWRYEEGADTRPVGITLGTRAAKPIGNVSYYTDMGYGSSSDRSTLRLEVPNGYVLRGITGTVFEGYITNLGLVFEQGGKDQFEPTSTDVQFRQAPR